MGVVSHTVCCVCEHLRLDHICIDHSGMMNPVKVACYVDEDAVGQIKRFAAQANPKRLSNQVMHRYAAYVCCRWLRRLES